jgi:hypothetical protein
VHVPRAQARFSAKMRPIARLLFDHWMNPAIAGTNVGGLSTDPA